MKENYMRENRRRELQSTLDALKSQEERNVLGQFATPTELAREIVAYAKSLLPPGMPVRFFDPALGTGSFYSALLSILPPERITAAEGYEIDPHYAAPAQTLWGNTPLKIHLEDFTAAKPPQDKARCFNLLVCNPPYVRHHHIVNGEKIRLQNATLKASGIKIAGLSGLYCYFMALSHPWMADGGVAAWLIPSEFMNVNYGKAVKRYLLTKVNLLRIHRFDPNDIQFEDALVSSAVVFFRNERSTEHNKIEFSFGGTIANPKVRKFVSAEILQQEPKWIRFPMADVRQDKARVTLGGLFRIKRGLATGDNKFFIFTRDKIEDWQLPWKFFRPILPSPRYLTTDHIVADRQGNPVLDKQLFILDCRLAEHEIKSLYPHLWKYLETGIPDVSERYLCRSRRPWYRQEDRAPAPFICTYIGRSDKKSGRPFRFILNESKAVAANVYLMMYPKPSLSLALAKQPSIIKEFWEYLNRIDAKHLIEEGRVYGGGLHKLEPKELANVSMDSIIEEINLSIDIAPAHQDLFDKDLHRVNQT